MTQADRWGLGLLLGAGMALAIHPESRSLWFEGLQWGASPILARAPELVENQTVLERESSTIIDWQWHELGLRRVGNRAPLSERESDELLDRLRRRARQEPENAYWTQAIAWWHAERGDRRAAREAWAAASRATQWRDPQEGALQGVLTRFPRSGRSWHYAALSARRSPSASESLSRLGRQLAREQAPERDLAGRLALLRNGEKIRNGSKSLMNGNVGARLVEVATYPVDVLSVSNPRRLLIARIDFLQALNRAGRTVEAELAEQSFRNNDAWIALTGSEAAREEFQERSRQSLLIHSVPGSLLITLGLMLGLSFAAGACESPTRARWFLGVLAGISVGGAWWMSQQVLTTLAVGGSFAALAWSPRHVRTDPRFEPGALYRLAVALVGCALVLAITAYVAGWTTPSWELAPLAGWSESLHGPDNIAGGVAVLVLALGLALTLPLAFGYRIASDQVAVRLLHDLGRFGSLCAALLLLVGTVAALAAERTVAKDLRERFLNEPLHLVRR